MKKYLKIDKDGHKEMDENEFSSFFIYTLFEHIYLNIEDDFSKSKKEVTYSLIGKNIRNRPQKIHRCLYQNCNNETIYSHSISEESVLRNIAKNSFLYKPSIDKSTMEKIGISVASLFPGFCDKHDTSLFLRLDDPNIINFDNDFFSQLTIRTASKEIYNKKRDIYCCEKLLERLEKEYNKSTDDFLQEFNKTLFNNKYSLKGFICNKSNLNEIKVELSQKIEKSNTFLQIIQQDFLSKNTTGLGIVVNDTLPVAFSGLCVLKTETYNVYLLINCLPYKNQTIVSINYAEYNNVAVQEFLKNGWLKNRDSLINFIELLAIRGTDNVFFNIDYWENMSEEKQKKYMNDFVDTKNSYINYGIDYEYLKWNWNIQE